MDTMINHSIQVRGKMLSALEAAEIVQVVRKVCLKKRLYFNRPCRGILDGEEASARVICIALERAQKNWDRARGPLAPYVRTIAILEIKKFQTYEAGITHLGELHEIM